MGKRVSPTLIGTFVVGAVVLAVVSLALFGSGKLFRETVKFVCYFQGTVNGLRVGGLVKFKGVEVGEVKEILLDLGERRWEKATGETRIPVVIELDPARISSRGGRSDIADPAAVDELIRLGLRAQLNMESLVTGVLFVALDVLPDTPVTLVKPPGVPYQELPTVPTALEQMRSAAEQLVAKMEEVNVKGLVDSAVETLDGIKEVVTSPELKSAVESLDETIENLNETITGIRTTVANLDKRIGPLSDSLQTTARQAGDALVQAESTLRTAQSLVEPDSPTVHELDQALSEVAAAARALRLLADYLERNPGALVAGKYQGKD